MKNNQNGTEIFFTGELRRMELRQVMRGGYKNGMARVYVYPTNHGWLTVNEMSKITGMNRHTINTRIGRYGFEDEYVFCKSNLPQGGNQSNFLCGRPKRSLESIKVGTWEAANL